MAFLARFVPDFGKVAGRFPVVVALVVTLAGINLLELVVWGLKSPADEALTAHLNLGFTLAVLAALTAHLWAEAQDKGRKAGIIAAIAVAAPALALPFLADPRLAGPWLHVSWAELAMIFFALIFALFSVPWLGRRFVPEGLWLAVARMKFAALTGGIISLVAALAVGAIIATLKVLFSIEPSERFFFFLFILIANLVAPLLALSLFPEDLHARPGLDAPNPLLRAISGALTWVVVPLLLLYALILHAYAAKILLEGTLPKGTLGWMVMLYVSVGYATWLAAQPMANKGLNRLFLRLWPWLLIVPLGLLVLAFQARVQAYGYTIMRVVLALGIVWALGATLYLLARGTQAQNRLLLAGAALLLFLGAVGPFSAWDIAANSQVRRVIEILRQAGRLDESGRFSKEGKAFSARHARQLRASLRALRSLDATHRLRMALGAGGMLPVELRMLASELNKFPNDPSGAGLEGMKEWQLRFVRRPALRLENGVLLHHDLAPLGRPAVRTAAGMLSVFTRNQALMIRLDERSWQVPLRRLTALVEAHQARVRKQRLTEDVLPWLKLEGGARLFIRRISIYCLPARRAAEEHCRLADLSFSLFVPKELLEGR